MPDGMEFGGVVLLVVVLVRLLWSGGMMKHRKPATYTYARWNGGRIALNLSPLRW